MNIKKFVTETKIISISTSVDSNCNTIVFFNTGTNNCFVDGIKITPGTSFTILGNENEFNVKYYSINFQGVGNPELTIIYKRYL